ncbi:DUF4360 domain-containing protein [Pseudobacteriovorax antillogorgiicola]|uniref:DUF4360 domain-containing protein n=1 Tax=Pseudobacteriovorax antillogorgiicola TaxID=1513793 RepID=A0A1Y6CKS1_9BACT|nr:DUF4360 domain-containing protein [Pseudobacteriovorax antillogorgiicola]TCS48244.1 uncharacterized protein DUF4360 [Pseudobacteriovorax antillogorgiicola]SMF57273.1 protein of unknown function [Pseudobacteriovorax antillogorgiicola]
MKIETCLLVLASSALISATASFATPSPELESYTILGNACNRESVEIVSFGNQLVVKPDEFEVKLNSNNFQTANCNIAATFSVDPSYSYALDEVSYFGLAQGKNAFVNFNREYFWAGSRSDQRNDLYFFDSKSNRQLQSSDADHNFDFGRAFQITDYVASDLGDSRGWSPCGAQKVIFRVSTLLTAGPMPSSGSGTASASILGATSEGPISATFKARPCQ